jgi:hypothetical protein
MTNFAIENNIENIIHRKQLPLKYKKQNITNRKTYPPCGVEVSSKKTSMENDIQTSKRPWQTMDSSK